MPDYTLLLQYTKQAFDEASHLAGVPDMDSQLQQLNDRVVGLSAQLTETQSALQGATNAVLALQAKIDAAKAALA